jgi:hypothetical protein
MTDYRELVRLGEINAIFLFSRKVPNDQRVVNQVKHRSEIVNFLAVLSEIPVGGELVTSRVKTDK